MTSTSPKAVVARFWDLYNRPGGIFRTPDLCSEDCVHEQWPAFSGVGKQAQRERVAAVAASFRDWTVQVCETVVHGEHVATRYSWVGTAAAPFGGVVAGTRLRLEAACFFTVRNGLIVHMSDVPGAMRPEKEANS